MDGFIPLMPISLRRMSRFWQHLLLLPRCHWCSPHLCKLFGVFQPALGSNILYLRETNVQGLLLDVIQKAAPEAYENRIKRQGIVNAWDDPAFAQAVRNTGKNHLIVAGVTTDVCLVPPACSMQGEGLHIKVRFLRRYIVDTVLTRKVRA